VAAPAHAQPIRALAAVGGILWTAATLVSFVFYSRFFHESVAVLAAAQARAAFQKDLAYRRWAAEHGGVYVDVEPDAGSAPPGGPPPRLAFVDPERLTQQVLERERSLGTAAGHVTAFRPGGAAEAHGGWEASALAQLAQGTSEFVELVHGEAQVLRFAAGIPMEPACGRCHEGRSAGELLGAFVVELPMDEYHAVADLQTEGVGIAHAIVWALGLGAIGFAASRATRRVAERERERDARDALETELGHARRLEAVGRLAGGVAHDLNNLLSPILGNSDLALQRAADPELRTDLEEIRAAAQRARVLTRQLLAIGRKQLLKLEPVDATGAVGALVPLLKSLVGDAIEVRVELAEGLPAIRADRAQLEAALLNLAANARDAMPHGGVLRITTSLDEVDPARAARLGVAAGPHVAIALTDSGAGIDEATRVRLFEPFFTTKPGGNGLGLASAHGTFRQLGGTVEVESWPGAGATFRVLLPPAPEGEVPALAPAPERGGGRRGTGTVLVAEDEPAVRRTLCAVLDALGYRVLPAADGEEALAVARAHAGELRALVTDVRMPRLGGPDLCARLRAERPGLATVLVTGHAGDAVARGVAHDAAVLHKPFTPRELADALQSALDLAAAAHGGEPSVRFPDAAVS
jgi:signal transduction histidine kinase/ActR/RegA family two-component response regulator